MKEIIKYLKAAKPKILLGWLIIVLAFLGSSHLFIFREVGMIQNGFMAVIILLTLLVGYLDSRELWK